MDNQEIMKKYDDVKSSLENAIEASDTIKLSGEEENVELGYIRKTLNQLNDEFKDEIDKLERSSEWDRFCMAFFGETNAGKSTIIDALRIVYDEETRREEINRQNEQFQEKLSEERSKYSDLVNALMELNNALAIQSATKSHEVIKAVAFVAIGIAIGFITGHFVL